MAHRNAEMRSLLASVARNTGLANLSPEDRRRQTQPATDARLRQYEDRVDPDRVLDVADRLARARSLMRADLARISAAGVAARLAKRQQVSA